MRYINGCFWKSRHFFSTISKQIDKNVENSYKRISLRDHVIHRPDLYIGSVKPSQSLTWVFDEQTNRIIQKEITYSYGFYKIFDEILINAVDQKSRVKNVSTIAVNVDKEKNVISVYNDGEGIPVINHRDYKMYIPTLIFGKLMTSSNYDDSESKLLGGRNGIGAKVCNIFSKRFTVETSNEKSGYSFSQTWTNNMNNCTKPVISSCNENDFTRVTFSPELKLFSMSDINEDVLSLIKRRIYDVAGTISNLKLIFNGTEICVDNFEDYMKLYGGNGEGNEQLHHKLSDNWSLGVLLSNNLSGQQISFVNGINTEKGGTHINFVLTHLLKHIQTRKMFSDVRTNVIRNNLNVFLNCFISNPTFDSQIKNYLALSSKQFEIQDINFQYFVNKMEKAGMLQKLYEKCKTISNDYKAILSNKRKQNKIAQTIPKLEDAIYAGVTSNSSTKSSRNCTLIVTEGDSAKTLVMTGLSLIGREYYGVYPLRGKIINPTNQRAHYSLSSDDTLVNFMNVLGLKVGMKFESEYDLNQLRYGSMVIMTDQDPDGFHIKGLLINIFASYWPDLLHLGFLGSFETPLIKVTKQNDVIKDFYSIRDYRNWVTALSPENRDQYSVKYFKGLGTITDEDIKLYFTNFSKHRKLFTGFSSATLARLEMVFKKQRSNDRKDWLYNYLLLAKNNSEPVTSSNETAECNQSDNEISFDTFIERDLIQYVNLNNQRNIPNIMDGLKSVQRKILYTVLMKHKPSNEIKVYQLTGSVIESTNYYHGMHNISETIVNMAQNFVGANNINLLEPIGQFGSRFYGGNDSAADRYIYTRLSPITQLIYQQIDNPLLPFETYENSLETVSEPDWYAPVIPMVLVNGTSGLGFGWKAEIPSYNPLDLIKNIYRLLDNENSDIECMVPFYRGYTGCINNVNNASYTSTGMFSMSNCKLKILELPLKTWTHNYKTWLNKLKTDQTLYIRNIVDYSINNAIDISVTMDNKMLKQSDQVISEFKLSKQHNISFVLYNHEMELTKYESVEEVLRYYFQIRLRLYDKRKQLITNEITNSMNRLSNQIRFNSEVTNGLISLNSIDESNLKENLIEKGYVVDDEEVAYFYEQPIINFTPRYLIRLNEKLENKKIQLDEIHNKSATDLWRQDLIVLEKYLRKYHSDFN